MSRTLSLTFALSLAVLPLKAAWGGESVYRFRTQEEAGPKKEPKFCERAPFASNLRLDAGVYVPAWDAKDGRVSSEHETRVGTAIACARLTDPRFTPGGSVDFYVRFELPAGTFTANGACTLVSNDVPEKGLVLAGCSLKVVDAPPGVVGGLVSSASVFNPAKVKGHETGSYWTLFVYEGPRSGGELRAEVVP